MLSRRQCCRKLKFHKTKSFSKAIRLYPIKKSNVNMGENHKMSDFEQL